MTQMLYQVGDTIIINVLYMTLCDGVDPLMLTVATLMALTSSSSEPRSGTGTSTP